MSWNSLISWSVFLVIVWSLICGEFTDNENHRSTFFGVLLGGILVLLAIMVGSTIASHLGYM